MHFCAKRGSASGWLPPRTCFAVLRTLHCQAFQRTPGLLNSIATPRRFATTPFNANPSTRIPIVSNGK